MKIIQLGTTSLYHAELSDGRMMHVTTEVAEEMIRLQKENEAVKAKAMKSANAWYVIKHKNEALQKEVEEYDGFFKWIDNHTTEALKNGIKLAFENYQKEQALKE